MARANGRLQHSLGSSGDEHVDIRPDQLSRPGGKIGARVIDIAIVDDQIAAFDEAELPQLAGEAE
jgi:hypothetical protein